MRSAFLKEKTRKLEQPGRFKEINRILEILFPVPLIYVIISENLCDLWLKKFNRKSHKSF